MEKTGLNWWSDRAWIKSGCLLTAVMTAVILVKWESWPDELKIIGAVGALVPIHVLEEWVFPGGFHYQYSTLQKSTRLDSYPMCRVSDMITNLGVTVLFMAMTFGFAIYGSVPAGILIACFSAFSSMSPAQSQASRCASCSSLRGRSRFTGLGSSQPTTVSSSLACSPSIASAGWLSQALMSALPVVSVIIFIVLPENFLKDEDSPCCFESAGYYERFLTK